MLNIRLIMITVWLLCFSGITPDTFSQDENPLNKQIIEQAEKVIGLNFTDVERDSMADGLFEHLQSYQQMRGQPLNNSIPPAIFFNPIPIGKTFVRGRSSFEMSDYSRSKMPEVMEELAFYSVGQLAHLIRTRKVSSVELTRLFLNRLKKHGPALECVITLTEELAFAQAKRADDELARGQYRGPLHGIPYGIKDLFSTRTYKTTWGAMPYKDQILDEDATVVRKLEEAGAVLVAKLSMGALAWGNVWYGGKTRNPWDITEGSSGSSAGSAAGTAAGLVPFAIGTETWGSIVSPCTVCGATGLRPTYGRVSRKGAMALSWTMDKIGPICRTVEDCALVFQAIHGPDGMDQSVFDLPFNYKSKVNLKDLKIGYLKSDFDKVYDFKKTDSLTLSKLRELGAQLIPIELPSIPVDPISFLLSTEAAAAFDELTRSNRDDLMVRQIKEAWPNVFRVCRFVPAVEYINANRIRYQLIQEMAKLMDTVDLYVAPSWEGDNLLLTNLTGHPCVVLPNGFSDHGTPTSISFIGRLFDEGTLLAVARAYQEATDFHLKHPGLTVDHPKKSTE